MDPRTTAAREALAQNDPDSARRIARNIANPAEARFITGLAEALQGRITAGITHLEAAIALHPTAEYLAQHARLLITVRREAQARAAADTARAIGPQDALTHDTIGCVYARLGDHHAALHAFEPAVAMDGGNLEFRYNLAAALGFIGRTTESAAQYEFIIARAPTNGRAHYALSGLTKASAEQNHIARLEAVLPAAPPADALRIRYALAKEYEELGQAEPAYRHLEAANTAHKARIGYDFAQDAAIFDALETGFSAPGFFTGPSTVTDAPIFITGMPRTGTTLVDRILSSHPQVHSAGEFQAMPLAIKQLTGTRSRLVIDPETIAASGALAPETVGRLYMSRANQYAQESGGRFIDKLPANSLYIAHIARALPAAAIICLRRHPLDTIWSNYKNLFATTSTYYHYSYDLLDTARYYARFDRLMAFWDRLLPGRILQLSYEALVANQEQQSRALYAHCNLEWTDKALDFHTQSAPVATPSAAQVRRPIYTDAVARWQAHAGALAPAKALLEEQGISCPPPQGGRRETRLRGPGGDGPPSP
ncbi:hypothetical protein GCM10011529_12000 [Polymorphobacter glacialis]|uniref:Sulfotransferase family protein n=1 Tax=Sandarakinorhabdus glacialis TaxID=1614636 RepID=A0A917E735_9SPHN|nr:sulfotransferase [Polymorphobacter glacialis]GGE07197.1 hypothetical protein GCM10011529_12000 [Polymorphobacter glacialis]